MTFLKTLLILVLVYYGLKIILKFLKPYLMSYAVKKANERFGKTFEKNSNNFQEEEEEEEEEEGNITIDGSQTNKKKSNPSVGEYVDYEELD
jgi:hypothetical protein